jgi:hypothetical protein
VSKKLNSDVALSYANNLVEADETGTGGMTATAARDGSRVGQLIE